MTGGADGGGFGKDVLLAALAASLAVHVGLMVWARPKVMTRVAEGIGRSQRHGSITIVERPEDLPNATVDLLADVEPEKEAPEVPEAAALVPSVDMTSPEQAEAAAVEAAFEPPQVMDRLQPDLDATVMLAPPAASAQPSSVKDPPDFALFGPPSPSLSAISATVPVAAFSAVERVAPAIEAPTVDEKAPSEDEVAKVESPKGDGKAEFTPSEEVLAEVDEKAVEEAKEVVKQLSSATDALDMREAVDSSMTVFREGGWIYFKAVFVPKSRLPSVPKDVVVLMDASGSIGKDRLSSCRAAAKRIMRTCTNTGDRFNLVAFRDKFSYAFKTWRECDAESFAAADAWLSKLVAHGRTDVFASIRSVLTLPRDPTRPLIALVVTDGDANMGVSETSQILSRFTSLNDGLVSVYMYGVRSSANRELIDVLTHGNRGESLVFEGWSRWSSGDGIEKLVERFRDPIVTDLRVVFSSACDAEAYPSRLRNVYAGGKVELFGRVREGADAVAFSLRGLAGSVAYEGFFSFPVKDAATDAALPGEWRRERDLDARLR